ncbi:magnesium-translocating P-type ATPase [Bradyrhizobium sp. BRP22]|uniref:magnesium-translocating P-type ATPase n=1 Tax=Bradyrhizobium sp. BRP22 TaxID=2793821 RepID=UPI001CD75358|nr:magnesium-translocating P-type ATPase [Bradyrhizobium sp. BRP22]MCA1455641.1 magnesium-translocating P-type ATPase [Bradyrhizobium sp. BRP22]
MSILSSSQPKSEAFWCMPTETLLLSLSSQRGGLLQAEAKGRLAPLGPNLMQPSQSRSILKKIVQRILNPLVAILITAAAISGISGDVGSFVIILLVISTSLTLDIVQEHRAEQTAEALRQSVAIQADVVRDGAIVSLPVSELVPGDIVHLRTGDLVPADGVALEVHELQVNEALMTGEPFPASKSTAPCMATLPAEASNALFAGTSVVSGSAVMLIVETGKRTRFGMIAAELATNAPPTALERGVNRLGTLILRLTLFLTLFVLLAHLAAHRPAMEAFLFALALAVGLTPELLPMIMTVTLAKGAQRMAARQVIVKRLSAIHDLGAMDTLCVDKTGTLTEAKITLAAHVDPAGRTSERVLELARLNAAFQTGVRSPIDDALLMAAGTLNKWERIAECPFDFQRRCLSVLASDGAQRCLIVKGAPESILARAAIVEIDGQARQLDAEQRAKLDSLQEGYARDGFRLLAIAVRPMPPDQATVCVEDETGLTLIGLCAFADPPKYDARDAIEKLALLGVTVKLISGDHAAVVTHVAQAVGLPTRRVMTGDEIAGLTDRALAAQVGHVDLFARVDPDQKRRIIAALRHRGHVVGFMGDGVNDAPAIHTAHVGISVAGATEVARTAADIILLAPDLSVLGSGVREGRRTFANILKYVRMGTSSNFGNMLSMALASVVLPFLPLLPLQILLNNLLYDLSEVGIPFDEVDAEDVAQPQAWDMAEILRFTLVMGTVSSLFDATTFVILLKVFHVDATQFHTGWFLESIATQILVIFLIRSRRLPWRGSRPDRVLVISSLGALAVATVLTLGPSGPLLGFIGLPPALLATIALITLAYLGAAEAAKRVAIRSRRKRARKSKWGGM